MLRLGARALFETDAVCEMREHTVRQIRHASYMQAMRQRIRESRHMWTYEYMAEYVTEKVASTAGDPQLDVYHANDTICEAGNYTTVRRIENMESAVSLCWIVSKAKCSISGAVSSRLCLMTADAHGFARVAGIQGHTPLLLTWTSCAAGLCSLSHAWVSARRLQPKAALESFMSSTGRCRNCAGTCVLPAKVCT